MILMVHVGWLPAQVVTYEASVFPELEGWEHRLADTPGADRSLDDGWFVQSLDLPDGWPEPTGDADFYKRSLSEFVDVDQFFIEWRAVTDNPSWLLDHSQVPAVVSAAGNMGVVYHTTLTDSKTQLFRTTSIPLVFVEVLPGEPHVYRVEMRGSDSFAWFIDGTIVETGVPRNPYPDPTAFLIWGARRSYIDASVGWDYLRFGVIPQDSSGDYDSDSVLTLFDQYFVHDCLTKDGPGIFGGPGQNAGPGCRFADFDSDTDADLLDFAVFQNLFSVE